MREDFWQFHPTHKLVLATNHRPIIRGTDWAVWRRIRLIPFTVTIPKEERDKRMPDKLRAEFPGILTWCVQGCLDWQRDGLGEPEEIGQATDDYRAEQDVLGEFIAERCTVDPAVECRARNLYVAYRAWADTAGDKPVTQRSFGQALTERGFVRKLSGGTWYQGLEVKAAADAF